MSNADDIHGITAEVRRLVAVAQAEPVSSTMTKAAILEALDRIRGVDVGPVVDYMLQIDALVAGEPPPPPPTPTVQFLPPFPSGVVVIFGRTKWLPGSLGTDGFCAEGTELVAPADCIVEEVIPGQGISGGAELILALADKSLAWRWRHVQAVTGIRVGLTVKQGQTCAVVRDRSLDLLGDVPGWAVQAAGRPFPSRYQHCDLSVAKRTDQFPPQGGGGGNYDADQWLRDIGFQGIEIPRTPGPPDAGFGLAEAVTLMTPPGRR